jgi:hypothetical protein
MGVLVDLPRSKAASSAADGVRTPAGKSLAGGAVAAQAVSSSGSSGADRRVMVFM